MNGASNYYSCPLPIIITFNSIASCPLNFTQNFLKQVEETKANIGPYLNLYQVHSATFDSGILINTEVHEALHRCRVENGWKIGLSVSGPNQDEVIREALKIHVSNSDEQQSPQRLFDSVQCTYNILEQHPVSCTCITRCT